ncbi:archaeosortase A [Methanolacinia paynteri]|uniref:archaeosortase A n=1 Tax=Methanolacinia paynteri TaxID=230356 RepID=UPI00064E7FA7|nr:archaeosortase A [Methanolacinia paynteri]
MEPLLIYAAAIFFIGFLLLRRPYNLYCAAAGWTAIILSILVDLPHYIFVENNFMYPLFGILGIPFLAITIPEILRNNKLTIYLSRGAAIAFLIYIPFGFYQPLGDWLIAVVTSEVSSLLGLFGFGAEKVAWNMIEYNNFRVEIILACTGIQSIAIMLGLAYCVPSDRRQKLMAFLLVVPTIYILNLLRNVFVVMAYTGQWFQVYPEIASNGEIGYESFFWAHNVMAELGALIFLVLLALGLFKLNPALGEFAEGIVSLYTEKIMKITGAGKDR